MGKHSTFAQTTAIAMNKCLFPLFPVVFVCHFQAINKTIVLPIISKNHFPLVVEKCMFFNDNIFIKTINMLKVVVDIDLIKSDLCGF